MNEQHEDYVKQNAKRADRLPWNKRISPACIPKRAEFVHGIGKPITPRDIIDFQYNGQWFWEDKE